MNTVALLARLQSVVALGTQVAATVLARAEALPGFGFSETMAGTIQLTGGAESHVIFHLRAAVPQLVSYLRDGRTDLSGDISIDGVAQAAPLSGSLWIWPHRSIIRYAIAFRGDDGQELQLAGQKDIRLLDFRRTITTLPAELTTAAGESLGHATVYFALADLPTFLRSFHPVRPDFAAPDTNLPADCPASAPSYQAR